MDYRVSFVGGDVVIVGGKVDFDYDTIYIYMLRFFTQCSIRGSRERYILS